MADVQGRLDYSTLWHNGLGHLAGFGRLLLVLNASVEVQLQSVSLLPGNWTKIHRVCGQVMSNF